MIGVKPPMSRDGHVPTFAIVTSKSNLARVVPRRERRNWRPLIDALVSGRIVFVPLAELSNKDVEYVRLALTRRGKGERLTTERVVSSGVAGRVMAVHVGEEGAQP